MTATGPSTQAPASPDRALRRLFLALFLRGRSARGLRRGNMPNSLASKLSLTLLLYLLTGCFAFAFIRHPVFELSLYLHGMTLVFCGMFIAASAGETLFNKEEADILLHRPVTPQSLLRAKLTVLLQVSLWIAGAFNLVGSIAGIFVPNGSVLYPIAHAASTCLEAIFCAGCVALAYELCLRNFGRERLESVMTMVQVFVAVGTVLAGQLVPRMLGRVDIIGAAPSTHPWWLNLLPPAWFAGLDDLIAGTANRKAMLLAMTGVTITSVIAWLTLGRMARYYETGLQVFGETSFRKPPSQQTSRRWLASLVQAPPLSWLLRDPVSRTSFTLVVSYLVRDRDVKLRVYPGLAPMLVMPIALLMPFNRHSLGMGPFGVAFCGAYMGLIPVFALSLLQFSQQWQAGDVFRAAPIPGPASLCAGARQAVTCFISIPLALIFALLVSLMSQDRTELALLLPGLFSLPIFTLSPHLGGRAIPFSKAGDEARSARRGYDFLAMTLISVILSMIATWAWVMDWFRWLLLGEILLVAIIYALMRASLARTPWPSIE